MQNRIVKICGQTVIVSGKNKPVKRGLEVKPGAKMSAKEYETHIKKHVGVPFYRLADQLSDMLEHDRVDFSQAVNTKAADRLRGALRDHKSQ